MVSGMLLSTACGGRESEAEVVQGRFNATGVLRHCIQLVCTDELGLPVKSARSVGRVSVASSIWDFACV